MKIQQTDEYGEVFYIETDEPEAFNIPAGENRPEEQVKAMEEIVRRKQGLGKSNAQRQREYRLRHGDNYRDAHAKHMRKIRAEGKAQ